jgi:hypothetical protein
MAGRSGRFNQRNGRTRTAAGFGENRGQQACIEQVTAAEILGFGDSQFPFRGLHQQLHLFRLQFAQIARFLIEDQRAVANAADFLDEVADLLEHFAQLAVATLDKDDFVPGIVSLADLADAGRRGAHLRRSGLATFYGDTTAENVELGFGGLAGDLDQVGFFHARGGLGEAVCQFTIVGDDEQPLANVIEATDGVEALLEFVEELHHRGPALGVLDGGDKASGLVEDKVAQTLGALEELAVDANVVAASIGLGAQFGNDLAVDLDAALLDHRLGTASAGDTGGGKNLL